jgi:peptidoglycan/LPS O-acetylase OafA/YrhL
MINLEQVVCNGGSEVGVRQSAIAESGAQKASRSSDRIIEIDALRGLAALSVLGMHYTSSYDRLFGHATGFLLFHPLGGFGVKLFFMISGFVILMTLDRTKNVADFAVGRLARLYPAYWAAGLVTFAVARVAELPGRQVDIGAALMNITMFQGFLGYPDIDPVYWTLQAEMQFYILMGAVVALRMRTVVDLVLGSLVGLTLLDRSLHFTDWPGCGLWRLHVYLPSEHLYLFLIGILIYESKSRFRWRHLGLATLCLIAAGLQLYPRQLCLLVLLGVLLFGCTRCRIPWLAHPALLFFGTISYTLYLVHQNIGYVVIRAGYMAGLNGYVAVACATGVAVLLAFLLTVFVERPGMRFVKQAFRRWQRRLPGEVVTVGSSA